jgi:hypothetical protein
MKIRSAVVVAGIASIALSLTAATSAIAGQDGGAVGATVSSSSRAPVPTGPVPRLPDGTVDLSGAWQGGGPVGDISEVERPGVARPRAPIRGPGEIPLLPWAKELLNSRTADLDPHVWCLPMGVPRVAGAYPWRFVQNYTHKAPTHLFILHEGNIHSYRQIFMDGRAHPAELDPTWYGHSIGKWEKGTLVIDTVGYNDKFWFDSRGHPHTEQLHTIERWTRMDLGHMVNEVTIGDPGAYSRPFTLAFMATLRPDDDIMEYICQENNQYGVAGGHTRPDF